MLCFRQPFPGPGLAIRIICAADDCRGPEYEETNTKLKKLVQHFNENDPHYQDLSDEERRTLAKISAANAISACILPLQTVGVQGDGRTYSYLCALSADYDDFNPPWEDLFFLARLIPKVSIPREYFTHLLPANSCFIHVKLNHNVNRVCFVFGERLKDDLPLHITPTRLTKDVISTLQDADDVVNTVRLLAFQPFSELLLTNGVTTDFVAKGRNA